MTFIYDDAQLHTYYFSYYHFSTDCDITGTILLLASELDWDLHISIQTHYLSINLEPYKRHL